MSTISPSTKIFTNPFEKESRLIAEMYSWQVNKALSIFNSRKNSNIFNCLIRIYFDDFEDVSDNKKSENNKVQCENRSS